MDTNTHHVFDLDHLSAGSGILRFRSAPSSFLATFTDDDKVGFDPDRLISGFVNSNVENDDLGSPNQLQREIEDKFPVSVTDDSVTYTAAPPPASYSGLPPHYPRQSDGALISSVGNIDGSDRFLTLNHHNTKPVDSNLVRQSSSPAATLSNISVQDGYGSMRSFLHYIPDEEQSPSSNGLKRHCSLSTRTSSSLGMLSQVSEIGSEFIGSGFQYGNWNDSSSFIQNFPSIKRESDNNGKMFSDIQNGEIVNGIQLLSHHLSLPKASSEMGSLDKFIQFRDSVPCKIRAKRGCATHPRSIAERVRRTRISERMKKLQELVPNMDKQTNTADMLDLAVDYIKDLQRQFKTMSDRRASCKCLNPEKKPV